MRSATLPLGIDIGSRRIRVALCERGNGGMPRLIAVGARDHGGDVVAALSVLIDELQTRERRCVVALGAPDALLRDIDFPPMPRWERVRAARFEASRFVAYPISEATISLLPASHGGWTMGIARRDTLASLLAGVRRAGLHALAVDDHARALQRVHGGGATIVDIGAVTTRVIRPLRGAPAVDLIALGGDHLTSAIAQSLGIDRPAAELRKRYIGLGGAGEAERDRLVAGIAAAVPAADPHAEHERAIVLCGNGARFPGFAAAVAAATGRPAELATLPAELSSTLPADVLRVAGPDWSGAFGLAIRDLVA